LQTLSPFALAMPESQNAHADRLDGLSHELKRLKRLVGSLQEELKTGLSGLFSDRASLRKRTEWLDEAAHDASSQRAKLEDRVAALEDRTVALESRREISSKSFESLSARLTELGIEVAASPPSSKVQHALEQVNTIASTFEVLTKRVNELEACMGRCRSDFETSLDRCQTHLESRVENSRSELECKVERSQSDLAATVQQCWSSLETVLDLNCQNGQETQQSMYARGATGNQGCQQSEERGQDVEALNSALCKAHMYQQGHMQGMQCRGRPPVCHQDSQHFSQQSSQQDLQHGCRQAVQRKHPQGCQEHTQPIGQQGQRSCSLGGGPDVDKDPRSWSESQLGLWLVGRGLPVSIARAFEAHLVNGLVAVDLNEDDLASMSITDQFHQRRVLKELRALLSSAVVGEVKHSNLSQDLSRQPSAPQSVCELPSGTTVPAAAVTPRQPALRPQATPSRPQSVPSRPQSAQGRPMPFCAAVASGRRSQPPVATAAARPGGFPCNCGPRPPAC